MNAIWHEIRQAPGQLRRSPAFTAAAVLILGLGLAVTLYMFTVVKAYMLTPLPYPNGDRIMHIERANLLPVLLLAVGMFGVLANYVSRQYKEIGIRLALGADARRVLRMVIRRGFYSALVGILAGIVFAPFPARGLAPLLSNNHWLRGRVP